MHTSQSVPYDYTINNIYSQLQKLTHCAYFTICTLQLFTYFYINVDCENDNVQQKSVKKIELLLEHRDFHTPAEK